MNRPIENSGSVKRAIAAILTDSIQMEEKENRPEGNEYKRPEHPSSGMKLLRLLPGQRAGADDPIRSIHSACNWPSAAQIFSEIGRVEAHLAHNFRRISSQVHLRTNKLSRNLCQHSRNVARTKFNSDSWQMRHDLHISSNICIGLRLIDTAFTVLDRYRPEDLLCCPKGRAMKLDRIQSAAGDRFRVAAANPWPWCLSRFANYWNSATLPHGKM